MKKNSKTISIAILTTALILLSFSQITIASELPQEEKSEVSLEKELKNKNEHAFYTFSDIKAIKDIPSMFKFFRKFISWKHWRYWVSILILVAAWFVIIMLIPDPNKIFSKSNAEKLKKSESNVYFVMWIIYSVILAIFFTFGYDHVLTFLEDVALFSLPVNHHWIHWVLWIGLVILAVGAIVYTLYNLIIFKLIGPYVMFLHIVEGLISILTAFFLTTMVTYLIIGIGIVIGVILAGIIGIAILITILTSEGSSSGNYTGSNSNQKNINEAHRRERERIEKSNRESLKNSRGW